MYNIFVVRNNWFHIKHVYCYLLMSNLLYFFWKQQKRGFFTANVANVIADYRNSQLVFFYAELAAPLVSVDI